MIIIIIIIIITVIIIIIIMGSSRSQMFFKTRLRKSATLIKRGPKTIAKVENSFFMEHL